jgi:Mn-dependent DtxR family transcriptional regulator
VHAEIAARVSIRREAVARELKALERAGLIKRCRGALVLTDTGRLRQLIEQEAELN